MVVAILATTLVFKAHAQTPLTADRQAALQAQLQQVLQEISDQQNILSQEQQKSKTLQGDINILNAQIKEAQLKIQARTLAIQALGKDISQKTDTINQLSGQIDQTHLSLAELVRRTNQMDTYTPLDVVLSDKDLSAFFADVDVYDTLKQSIQVSLGYIKKTKEDTETAKQVLGQQQLEEIDAKISIEQEQAKIKVAEDDKSKLLSLSKAQQLNYQSQIAQKQAEADKIRSALFALRDVGAIQFGDALQYATEASKITGVRPAFLLAILTQESNLGANVGSCYLLNKSTGAGTKVTSGTMIQNVMNPTRDVPPFMIITANVGRDPMQTRVSCPIGGSGYGGAMGPSQFIPSTWMLFQDRIAQAIGKSMPDPWQPRDAFVASALYLDDLGAGAGTYSSERNAACRYYSGRACDSKKPANSAYGDQVMAKASNIQTTMIDPLSGL